jgi:antitoxin YefM
MKIISITQARKNIFKLLEETIKNSEPVQIKGKNGSAVLVSESDWRSIQETLHLLSIPGMRESIIEGGKQKIEECISEEDIDW